MKTQFANRFIAAVLLSTFALGTLAACGIKGDLKTPPPIWGDKSKAEQPKTDNNNSGDNN